MDYVRTLFNPFMEAAQSLGYWAYPAVFGINILLSFGTLVLIRSRREQIVLRTRTRVFLRIDAARFDSPFWSFIHRRGAFLMVMAAALVSPILASWLIRFLQLGERRAIIYAFATTLIDTGVKVSLALGVSNTLRDALGMISLPG
ncbi:hypothetical protein HY633_00240 [Candidatus Uhrbacteria bacterium]|nr:hypothetical protein [Candidatus Uhrbacteria bacterium]